LRHNQSRTNLLNQRVLQDVCIHRLKFKLMYLEAMHPILPLMTSLSLQYVYPIHGEIPRNVKSATLITELDLTFGYIDTHSTA
jgi:hypothetical protein